MLEGKIWRDRQSRRFEPVTLEWCKANGSTGFGDKQWFSVSRGEWVQVTFSPSGVARVSYRGVDQDHIQNVGDLEDLLKSLRYR